MSVSFQPSIAGMQSGMRLHESAATRISSSTAFSTNPDTIASCGYGSCDITAAVGEMKMGETGYAANSKVIRAQDKMLGELLDLIG